MLATNATVRYVVVYALYRLVVEPILALFHDVFASQGVVGFLLEVRPQNLPAYQTESKRMIPRLSISQSQSGATILVKIDPQNQARVALDIFALSITQIWAAPADAVSCSLKHLPALCASQD